MAKSVLNKSLKLFEEDIKVTDREGPSKSFKKNSLKGKTSGIQKRKRETRREGKNLFSVLSRKKDVSGNQVLENNLQILEKLRQKEIDRNSSARIVDYQLTKSHKVYKAQEKEKISSTVFTDEDFEKFEREYFTKH